MNYPDDVVYLSLVEWGRAFKKTAASGSVLWCRADKALKDYHAAGYGSAHSSDEEEDSALRSKIVSTVPGLSWIKNLPEQFLNCVRSVVCPLIVDMQSSQRAVLCGYLRDLITVCCLSIYQLIICFTNICL